MEPQPRAADQSLLMGLLAGDAPAMPPATPTVIAPATPTATTPPATPRTRPNNPPRRGLQANNAYERLMASVALLFALALAGAIWLLGASMTLGALQEWGMPIARLGVWQWAIPAAISASEIMFWPARHRVRSLLLIWVVILLFDLATTMRGLMIVIAGRQIEVMPGVALPTSGPVLVGGALIVGLVCAFGPEKIGRVAVSGMQDVWGDTTRRIARRFWR